MSRYLSYVADFAFPTTGQPRLVLALGAEAKLDVVPGSAEYALPFSTLEDACTLLVGIFGQRLMTDLYYHSARKIAYLFRLPTDEHRLKVGMSWLAKSAVDSVALFQTTVTKVITGSTVLLVARDGLSAVRPSVHFSTHGSDQSQVRKETTACIMLTAFSLLGSRRWNTCCSPAASISRASPSHPLRSSAS
ncbi:hypothetical protein BHM03_00033190 [Ensete ventricosum]|nr:hypothetical protein BHM03_00033190 [Ensete ventricosum]